MIKKVYLNIELFAECSMFKLSRQINKTSIYRNWITYTWRNCCLSSVEDFKIIFNMEVFKNK